MTSSFRAFMTGLIDYAGLFPPARLVLEDALRNYVLYLQGTDSWMLSRFICPCAWLEKVAAWTGGLTSRSPTLVFSVLGRGGSDCSRFLAGLENDLSAIRDFCVAAEGRVVVDAFEVKLPDPVFSGGKRSLDHLLDEVTGVLKSNAAGDLTVFFESPPGVNGCRAFPRVIDAIARSSAASSTRKPGLRLGFKLRCGGERASAVPAVDQVVSVIVTAVRQGVLWKATAGLHHPFIGWSEDVGTRTHGFLNLFGAAVLAQSNSLSEREVAEILGDEDSTHFRFQEEFFEWKGRRASIAEIVHARRSAFSLGSCSFDEPREDLRRLGFC
ncbi:MAG: hypothetical protein ACE5JX_17450 [Acidobacteriota bacterium]